MYHQRCAIFMNPCNYYILSNNEISKNFESLPDKEFYLNKYFQPLKCIKKISLCDYSKEVHMRIFILFSKTYL